MLCKMKFLFLYLIHFIVFHSFNYYFYSAQSTTVFRDSMCTGIMNVSFMVFDSLKNFTADYTVVYFSSPKSHNE